MEIHPFISHINNIVSLTSKEEEILLEKTKYRKYLKDQYIVQQGDVCKHINFIIKGCTKTFHLTNDGQEHIILFSIEDWWSADMGSFITETPADYSVQCVENTDVIQIEKSIIEDLYTEIPKLERFFRIITQRALVSSRKRIVRGFSKTAKERYLIFKQSYPELEKRVPQYMVASYLGITKEFLSKIKRQIAKE
ncbi:Crp/Fnr family transcriptional regulator [Tenacibaculum sp. M341]|uniref:Crp/Fnr family transcriptional regulator n=1 Tax=Tenacibaculum sp. M341 TaxID=2530339 RepID=UPI0010446531|nr:Crp/Fnr family transcriptional regulator [Tenacibaculum sp. M341]TCI92683.1 Crp/Fnr family transcriptional regulator [Tenacibaculum sp. M341]